MLNMLEPALVTPAPAGANQGTGMAITPTLIEHATLGSTNDWMLAAADTLADETWVRADAQTAGRGRHGRRWSSLPGNLFATVLVRPQPGEGAAQQLSFVAALALADAVAPWQGRLRVSLKWPNDVLLSGGKLAGILLESCAAGTVAGFGVNVAHAPAGVDGRVAALSQSGRAPPAPATLLDQLRPAFAAWRRRWRNEGFAAVRVAWLARATPVGWRARVRQGDVTRSGVFAGMADDGAMLFKGDDGRIETIHAGEVLAS